MKIKYLIGIIFLSISIVGKAQITSYADYSESTEYSDLDKIFVFCTDNETGASLTAVDSTGNGGKEYSWYSYNVETNDFTEITTGISYNADSSQNTIVGLTTGGYKVIVTGGTSDQQYFAWVYNTTDRFVELEYTTNDCDRVALRCNPYLQPDAVNGFATPLNYVDTVTGTEYTFENRIDNYSWNSDTEPEINPSIRPYNVMNDLPTENTIFKVIVTDRFGCVEEDTIFYDAIATEALFSWRAYDRKKETEETGDNNATLSQEAPIEVYFKNESKNGYEYIWCFGDSTRKDDEDTVRTFDYDTELFHTYYYTDNTEAGKTYTMNFKSISDYGCRDSVFFDINLKPVTIEFPNVFTPNDDGVNDLFYCDSLGEGPISIRNFKITIFTKAGQVVHEYEGSVYDWEGWDGKVKNSGRKASEGYYYYIVEILGWDKKDYNNYDYVRALKGEADSGGDGKPVFGVIRLYR